MKRLVVVPGSFDPPTNGHVDIISRASKLFDSVIVLVSKNTLKKSLFSTEERVEMLQEIFHNYKNITVDVCDSLVAVYAKEKGAVALVRGLRNTGDYSYESEIWHVNRTINSALETVFLPASNKFSAIRSSSIRELALYNQDVSLFVPPVVALKIKQLKNA